MTTTTMERPGLSAYMAAEIRAAVARQGLTQTALAKRIGHNNGWLSTRISPTATVDMTVDEVAEMAEALGVDAEGLMLAALRACRDSNPKPSDPGTGKGGGVKRPLTLDSRNRSGWVLAA